MAVLLLWLLDASNNTAMEPYRAFIADKLPPSQLGKGFLAQSFFTGFGITLANVSLFVFQSLINGATSAGIPYWVVGSFMLGAVCSIGTVLVSVITHARRSRRPRRSSRRCGPRRAALGPALTEIWDAIVEMPPELRKLGAGLPVPVVRDGLLLAVRVAVDRPVGLRHDDAEQPRATAKRSRGPAWSTAGTTSSPSSVAFPLVAFARKRGAKMVHIRLPAARRGRAV